MSISAITCLPTRRIPVLEEKITLSFVLNAPYQLEPKMTYHVTHGT
jgi:hypothetical protein